MSFKVILPAGTDVSELLLKFKITKVAIKENVAEEMDVILLLAKDREAIAPDAAKVCFKLKFPLTELIRLELKSKSMPLGAVIKLNVASPLTDVIKL